MKKIIALTVCISIPLILGGIAGVITAKEISTWYVYLVKPSFNPPNYLFGPVWTTLYILMGVSFYLIVSKKGASVSKRKAYLFYTIQLGLNFLWSFLFFYFHQIDLALIEIALMWLSIVAMIYMFYLVSKPAAWLNLPYLAWVSFATLLNASICYLN